MSVLAAIRHGIYLASYQAREYAEGSRKGRENDTVSLDGRELG